jgi:hypothetical protein
MIGQVAELAHRNRGNRAHGHSAQPSPLIAHNSNKNLIILLEWRHAGTLQHRCMNEDIGVPRGEEKAV